MNKKEVEWQCSISISSYIFVNCFPLMTNQSEFYTVWSQPIFVASYSVHPCFTLKNLNYMISQMAKSLVFTGNPLTKKMISRMALEDTSKHSEAVWILTTGFAQNYESQRRRRHTVKLSTDNVVRVRIILLPAQCATTSVV